MWSNSTTDEFTVTASPLPLLSSCVNCCISLSACTYVSSLTLPTESRTRVSVFQGLQLIFKGEQENNDQSNSHQFKLCLKCGKTFGKIVKLYHDFLRSSVPDSYVQHLVRNASTTIFDEKSQINNTANYIGCSIKPEPLDNELIIPSNEHVFELQHYQIATTSENPLGQLRRSARKHTVLANYGEVSSVATSTSETAISDVEDKIEFSDRESSQETRYFNSDSNNVDSDTNTKNPGRNEDSSRLDLKKHSNVTTKLICELCSMGFKTKRQLKMHQGKHRGERPFDCDKCNTSYKTKEYFVKHNVLCHSTAAARNMSTARRPPAVLSETDAALLVTTEYKCHTCQDISLSSFKEWVIHHSERHQNDYGYGDVTSKEIVKPRHGLNRPCPQCGKMKKFNTQLLNHIKIVHQTERPFSCDFCPKMYATIAALRSHVSMNHNANTQEFLCTLCGRRFKSKCYLEYHEKTHTGEHQKTFECETCHVMFENKFRLLKHKSLHMEERPYKCDKCGNSFKAAAHLREHKRKSHYKKHILDQICDFCGKAYAFKETLKEHLMGTHKLSKDDARVSAKIRIRTIFRVLPNGELVIPEKPSKSKTCGFCQRTYVRLEQLFTHLMSVHGKTQEEAKEITGLESKRNLVPGANAGKRRTLSKKHLRICNV